jgi:hypothetical protein
MVKAYSTRLAGSAFSAGARKMNRKSRSMPRDTIADQCANPAQELSIKIPRRLAQRVNAYARENGTDTVNVVIEALDVFLRERKDQWK